MQHWYLYSGNNEFGPMSAAELRDMLVSGRLKESDFVSRAGDARWTPALDSGPRLLEEITLGPGAAVSPSVPPDPLAALAGASKQAWNGVPSAFFPQLPLGLRGAGPTATLVILMGTLFSAAAGLILLNLEVRDFIERTAAGADPSVLEGRKLERAASTLDVAGRVVFLVITVVFCVWVHGAATNVRRMGAQGLTYTPGWAVGGYFIPILNLFRPVQAMQEIWRASDPEAGPNDWIHRPGSGMVGLWWAMWIIGNIVHRVSASLNDGIERKAVPTLDQLQTVLTVDLVSQILVLAQCVVAVMMILTVRSRQKAKYAALCAAAR